MHFLPTKRIFWIRKRDGSYRMVRFGGHPTQVEGAGGDTVKNLS
jgi:hypothetical protein